MHPLSFSRTESLATSTRVYELARRLEKLGNED